MSVLAPDGVLRIFISLERVERAATNCELPMERGFSITRIPGEHHGTSLPLCTTYHPTTTRHPRSIKKKRRRFFACDNQVKELQCDNSERELCVATEETLYIPIVGGDEAFLDALLKLSETELVNKFDGIDTRSVFDDKGCSKSCM